MLQACSPFWVVLWIAIAVQASSIAVQTQAQAEETSYKLEYRPAPVDNPLKGLVPYQGDVREMFPHSMEFNYLPYSALVKGYDEFDWSPLEELLEDIASRGHQAVFRVYLEYPNRSGVVPTFLVNDGLKVHKYVNTNTQPFPPAEVETPDYENESLRRSLKRFIAALGKRYDGDPRIGFITAGLLGTWGEWHTYPREELFASKQVQQEVMDAYEGAFHVTPVLLRYPVGTDDDSKAANANRPFGYHDDSFAWSTLSSGKADDDWFYMTRLKGAGPRAEAKWKTHPIGGEIRPQAWGRVFDANPGKKEVQNFRKCVEATHVSWLMDSGMFEKKQKAERFQRAIQEVRRMGYEFHVPTVTIGDVENETVSVRLQIENRGVAPFYYHWTAEYGLLASGKFAKTFKGTGELSGLLPNNGPRVWNQTLSLSGVNTGVYTLAVRVPNSLKRGNPVRFANASQDADAAGWLSLGLVNIP